MKKQITLTAALWFTLVGCELVFPLSDRAPNVDVRPSCVDLEPTCGASGDEDCCATAEIPGGTFDRSRDLATDGMFTDASHPATVQPFLLDTYEVTVGRFRRFVDAGMGTRDTPPDTGAGARELGGVLAGGWETAWSSNLLATPPADLHIDLVCDPAHSAWTPEPGENESFAMSCVNWFEAFAFCVYDGGFLPTEAEWNLAAAGGADQRAYPWSVPADSLAVDCSFTNFNISPDDAGPFCSAAGTPAAVGASPKGDGRWGHADLAGNVSEWVLDGYLDPYANPCDGCANLTNTGHRVVRGGNWANGATTLRTGYRNHTDPQNNRDPKVGFRCARAR